MLVLLVGAWFIGTLCMCVYVGAYLLLHNTLNLLFCLLEIMLGHEADQIYNEDEKKPYNVGILNPEVKNKSIIIECSQRVDTIIFHFFIKQISLCAKPCARP